MRVAHEVVGDLDGSLARLAALPAAETTGPRDALRQHRDAFQAALRPATAGFAPHQAIDVVRRVLPREGVLAFDVGAHTHQIASQWTAHAPRTFLITNGWSSMGFGIPGALAAKLARPDLPVVCVLGDGCFQMTCGEVAVARRVGLAHPVRRARRPLAVADQGQAEPPPFPLYGTELQAEDYTGRPRITSACPRSACAAPQR